MYKDKIIIWTPDPPEGYGTFDQDDEDELLDEANIILQEEFEDEDD
jgi:hypothetical protein